MPCTGCKKDTGIPRPDISEWGPLLWKLLHSLSLQHSKQSHLNSLLELKYKWKYIYDTLPFIVPCTECRDHVVDHIKENSYVAVKSVSTDGELVEFNTRWLYDFHNAVNVRLGKPTFAFDDLVATYSDIDISSIFSKHVDCMALSVAAGDIGLTTWTRWKANVAILISLYCS